MSPASLRFVLRLLLALLLLAFLGAVLRFLWTDLKHATAQYEQFPTARLSLVAGTEPVRQLPLETVNLVGRAADNSLRLTDSTVSAYHARLSLQGGQWWPEDLGSRNGTFVNDLKVESPMVVTYGDRIGFGRVSFRLEAGPASDIRTAGSSAS